MKKIKSILLIAILYFALFTTNSFAAEEFTLSKEYLTLLPYVEYTLTCSDDVLSYDYTILNETSVDYSGNSIEDNLWLNCNFENNLVYIEPYMSCYIGNNEATIKLSITSVNNETKDCIIHVPSVKRVWGVNEMYEIFPYALKIGTIINLKPKIEIDSNYIYYTKENITMYNHNYFFVIEDRKEIIKEIDDYSFEIQKIGKFYLQAGGTYSDRVTYDGSVFEFMSNEKIVVNKNEVFNIELNSDYQIWDEASLNITNLASRWSIEDNDILRIVEAGTNSYYDEDNRKFYVKYENECEFFAKNVGTTKIIVKSAYDNHVIEKEVEVINPVKKITFDKKSLELNIGEAYDLIATITPTDATYKDLTWTSSNENVVTVDENGKVTAVGSGLAVISAVGYGDVEERCVVLVKDNKPNNIIITTLPVTSNIKFAQNTAFSSITTVENFPILGYEGYGLKLYSSSGEEKANDSILGSKDIISVYDANDIITTYNVVVKGDISGDGNVRIYDSFQILKDVLTNKELDEVDTEIRDYNSDGRVAVYDAFQYLKEAILN